MELLICVMVFIFFVFSILAFVRLFTKRDLYLKRIELFCRNSSESDHVKPELKLMVRKMVKKFSGLFAARAYTEKIQAKLTTAGIPLKGEEYITICLVLIIVLPFILYMLTFNLWLSITAIILGGLLPGIYVQHKKESRLLSLNQQLGDALVVMANALRAGFGFQQAMDAVRRELPPPISSEFSWTLRDMNLGFGYEEALLNLSKRVKSNDLDMVITGIIIQRQVGGNLAVILENISETIRERARIKREIKILTAQGRLSGLIIGVLPVVLILAMLLINPEYFNDMINDRRGQIMLATALMMEILGALIVKKVIKIDF